MVAAAWSFERSGWGGHKYITPELLRAKGIGTGFYQNPGGLGDYSRYGGPTRPGDVPDGNQRTRYQGAYNLQGWQPWNEWGGQSRYDELVKQYQDAISQMSAIPQVGSEEDLARLTELDKQARGYQTQAQEHRAKGRGIQDDYIKEWLKAYDIRYNPDAEIGGGRYSWDTSTNRGRDMQQRSDWRRGDTTRTSGGGYVMPHWTSYGDVAQGRQDTKYRTINQHKWDDHALGALQRFKLKPPEPPPRIPDPAVDKTTTTNEHGRTDVEPMPDMDWFSGSPRGAEGVATQRGLTGRKKNSKYGKSFKRGDRENSLTTDSLNI